jgi:hypothetical protein
MSQADVLTCLIFLYVIHPYKSLIPIKFQPPIQYSCSLQLKILILIGINFLYYIFRMPHTISCPTCYCDSWFLSVVHPVLHFVPNIPFFPFSGLLLFSTHVSVQ